MQKLLFLVFATALLFIAAAADAAGFRFLDIPAGAEGPALHGAMWYPCAAPPGEIHIEKLTLPGVVDCPIRGAKLPLIVVSHGHAGDFVGHHDTAEALADAGFVVAAINHPGDTADDMSRADDLAEFFERPVDIKRLIDFMLAMSPAAPDIDPARIGIFAFSRGGYTALVLVGADIDWARVAEICEKSTAHACQQVRDKAIPAQPLVHDPRIKAAVIADPLAIMFSAKSFAAIKVPVQLWASERGGDGVTPDSVAAVNEDLPAPHEYRAVPNSVHFAFLAPCPPAMAQKRRELCTDPPAFDRVAFHRQFDADVLAFFRAHLGEH